MAKWLKGLRSERNEIKQGIIQIATKMVTQQKRKAPNWKCPRLDGVKDFWLTNFPDFMPKNFGIKELQHK